MINLLPPSFKERLQTEENFRLILILATSFAVFLVCLALLLFAFRVYLWGKIRGQEFLVASVKEQSFSRSEELKNIQALNLELLAISGLYEKRLSPAAVLESISSHLKQDMYLSSLNMAQKEEINVQGQKQMKPGKIVATGFASKRETLFEFREDLQKEELFKNIYFPPSNWVKPVDITFSFSAELK